MEKEFTLFWLTGKSEIVKGNKPNEAMMNAGYGGGAVRALDFYAEGDKRDEYVWNKERHSWISKKIAQMQ